MARNFGDANRGYLLTSLLYAPVVVIHDPIAEWFDSSRPNLKGLPGIPSASKRVAGGPAMVVAGDELTLLGGRGYYASRDRVGRNSGLPGR